MVSGKAESETRESGRNNMVANGCMIYRQLANVKGASDDVILISGSECVCKCICIPWCWMWQVVLDALLPVQRRMYSPAGTPRRMSS